MGVHFGSCNFMIYCDLLSKIYLVSLTPFKNFDLSSPLGLAGMFMLDTHDVGI